jgi:hypothetical protein
MNKQALYAHRILNHQKALRGGKCQIEKCRAKKNLEFHHIKETNLKGRGRGLVNRAIDIKKNPDHYILVCRKHHVKPHPEGFLSAEKKTVYKPKIFYVIYPEGYFNSPSPETLSLRVSIP